MKYKIAVIAFVSFILLALVACGQNDSIATENIENTEIIHETEKEMPTIELRKNDSSMEEPIVVEAVFEGELHQDNDDVYLKLNSPAFFQQAGGKVINVTEIYFDASFGKDFVSYVGVQVEIEGSVLLNVNPIKFYEAPIIVKAYEANTNTAEDTKNEERAAVPENNTLKENTESDNNPQSDDTESNPIGTENVKIPESNGTGFPGAFTNTIPSVQDDPISSPSKDDFCDMENNINDGTGGVEQGAKVYRYYRYYAYYVIDEYTDGTISTFSEADALNFIAQEQGTLVGRVYYDEITCTEYMGNGFADSAGNYYYLLG